LIKNLLKQLMVPITNKPGIAALWMKKTETCRARNGYAKDLLKAMRSNFKQVTNLLQEGVDADGGYLVPEEYDKRIIDHLGRKIILCVSLGLIITTSGEHKINIAATKPAAAWIEEGGSFSLVMLNLHRPCWMLISFMWPLRLPKNLLYDNAFNLENYIITEFGKAMANAEEDAFLNGDGTGKPLGFLLKPVVVP
jgi:HK97 family phage major capsid protein